MAVVDLSDFKEFPATDLLGFGLDFTTLTPMDIQSVGVLDYLVLKVHTDHGSSSDFRSSGPRKMPAELSGTIPTKTRENIKWVSIYSESQAWPPSVNPVA